MNSKVLRVLEYHKIIDRLKEKASSEPGRQLAAALVPMTDLEENSNRRRHRLQMRSGVFLPKAPHPLAVTKILA